MIRCNELRVTSKEKRNLRSSHASQGGFTIPELLIAVVLMSFLSSLLVFYGLNYWRYSSLLEADASSFVERLNAEDFVREKIGTTSGLILQNGIADSHTNNPDPAINSGLYWIPLHAIPKNTVATGSGTSALLYFKRFSISSTGSFIMNGTQPYEDEYVLYVDKLKNQLLLRSLANTSASGNILKSSCPIAQATAACPADKIIISRLSSIDTKYFSKSGNTIDWTSATDASGNYNGPDFPVVEVMEFNFHIAQKAIFQKTKSTSNDTVVRIALRNT